VNVNVDPVPETDTDAEEEIRWWFTAAIF